MNTATNPKETIFEVNKNALLNAKKLLPELNQNNKNKISIKLDFYNYSELGYSISSLLNAVIKADEEEIKKEPIMFQKVIELSNELLNSIPLFFLDHLLISDEHNKENFTNLKNL